MSYHIRISLFLQLLCLMALNFSAKAADTTAEQSDKNYSIGINVRPSYVMATHGFYNGWNPSGRVLRSGGTADVQFAFSNGGRGAYYGAGIAVHTFGANDMLGTPATFYIFQGAPLALICRNLAIGYEWNLGLSSGWKDNGIVTVSPMNVYINVAALFTWKINRYWDCIFGPEYTHFSNGDTRFPNGGANTINFRLGAKRHIFSSEKLNVENIFQPGSSECSFKERISYDVSAYGGWRADRSVDKGKLHIFNQAFPVACLNFNPLYVINRYISAGPSVDLLYDRSANLVVDAQDDKVTFSYPRVIDQTSVGLSARAELKMPIFAVNIGIGYGLQIGNHNRCHSDLNAFYGIFALKAFTTDRLYLSISYRLSSVLYSHNLLFGIGWRFGAISHP